MSGSRLGGNEMDQIKKALGNAPTFVVAYVIFMLPTYFLPYAGSNSFVLHTLDAAVGTKHLNAAFYFHMGSMLVLCFMCWVRGSYVSRNWLLIFPILAIVFDFVPGLSVIPLIPTGMHLAAIIAGVAGAKANLPPAVAIGESEQWPGQTDLERGAAPVGAPEADRTALPTRPTEYIPEQAGTQQVRSLDLSSKRTESQAHEELTRSPIDQETHIVQPHSVPVRESARTSFSVPGAPKWVLPGIVGVLVAAFAMGGILYYQTIQRDAERRATQERLAQEQERTRQKEEEARGLAERVARFDADQKAQAERQRLLTELEQQRRENEELRRQPANEQQRRGIASAPSTQTNVQAFAGSPTIQLGDRYTYETLDLFDSKLNNVTTREIVQFSNGVYTQRNVNTKSGHTRFIRLDGSWNILGGGAQSGDEVNFQPPFKYFDFPLQVGKTWESRSTETSAKTGATRTHIIRGRVEGQETINVPAGTFQTLKVVLNTETTDGIKRISGTDVSWYAPAARRTVRSEMESLESDTGKKGKRVVQLLSFDLR